MVMEEHNQEAMGENVEFEDWEAEETLSFCDLPIFHGAEAAAAAGLDDRRSSSDHDFFEFFNEPSVKICPAESIIFCGKLISYKENESATDLQNCKNITTDEDRSQNFMKKSFLGRRSESLNELQSSRSSVKGGLVRNCQSLDYRKFKTASPTQVPANDRNSSQTCFGKFDYSTRRASISFPRAKSRWQLLMFGSAKFPPEMQLKDIRNRQTRRLPSSLFPASVGAETDIVKREKAKGPWRALRGALSCKGHAKAAVTAALGCIPYVQFTPV